MNPVVEVSACQLGGGYWMASVVAWPRYLRSESRIPKRPGAVAFAGWELKQRVVILRPHVSSSTIAFCSNSGLSAGVGSLASAARISFSAYGLA